ncbi:putative Na+/H+ antiporter [Luteolibacter sp. AS25]|uniref:putative Na+/H+ antiporter n=1 Tax=Luteolibacter sp. AS25 TaxID=3135776 RepID=UPI00398B765D
MKNLYWALLTILLIVPLGNLKASSESEPAYILQDGSVQNSHLPLPMERYEEVDGGLLDVLKARVEKSPFNLAATIIFFLAIIHTFAAGPLNKVAHKLEVEHAERLRIRGPKDDAHPDGEDEVSFGATVFHFLGEVEAIFGLWIIALAGAAAYFYSWTDFKVYINDDRSFTEPMFVAVIMAIAASRPVLRFAEFLMSKAAGLGKGSVGAWWLSVLIVAPILGSFITEPAAMTIAAMLLAKKFYRNRPSKRFAYATIGLLFVNISVGGTLTNFAAPPVLMVAGPWDWSTPFMLEHFGWKAVVGILIATSAYFAFFRKELAQLTANGLTGEDATGQRLSWQEREDDIPAWITFIHLLFLGWTVYTVHYPVLFVGGFLFFLAFRMSTRHHQNSVSLRSPILVGFFLAGLIVHGGLQGWWIDPVIRSLNDATLMIGSTVLTAFNDNAAITYLASQVDGLSISAKHAVVAGAVTGGGLTVIANAPNPAGQSILSRFFKGGVSPLFLLLGALIPTAIMYSCFVVLPNGPAKEGENHGQEHVEEAENLGDIPPAPAEAN